MVEAGLDTRQRRKVVDKVAAAVMLQAWLDHRAATWRREASEEGA
jgi:putative Holliday junction resolvase